MIHFPKYSCDRKKLIQSPPLPKSDSPKNPLYNGSLPKVAISLIESGHLQWVYVYVYKNAVKIKIVHFWRGPSFMVFF